MSRDFLALYAGSNRGAPVTDANPVPVKFTGGDGPTGLSLEDTQQDVKAATEAMQAALEDPNPAVVVLAQDDYEACAASATTVLGAVGGAGDYLAEVVVFPGTLTPGSVTIKDGSTTVAVFAGGSGSVSNLVPFPIPVGAKSVSGAWSVVTTGNVTALATGDFA